MRSIGHSTKRLLRSPPFAVTLNFCPLGLKQALIAGAHQRVGAERSCATSEKIGMTRPEVSQLIVTDCHRKKGRNTSHELPATSTSTA